ncbi:MAG TPA: nuclear transport factor 2 family protein [Gaiellales bacterium]|nr:nuclear transport factor 2 family protein [Gaiellales bacterium]
MDVLELHARVTREFERRDLESYLALMHPEVEFTTVAFGEERVFRGHDGVRDWWEELSARAGYDAYSSTATPITEDAILIRARIRAPNQSGGYLDAAAEWLLVARDGLVWRYRPVESEADARAEYARLGSG